MAAVFTQVSLEDMVKYLSRAFRILDPKPGPQDRGEITYDLSLSDNVAVRVFTTIGQGRSTGAEQGSDAIRVGLYSLKTGRPLKTGKLPIVKRTQNWRDNLRERIEDELHDYDDREGYWEFRATGKR